MPQIVTTYDIKYDVGECVVFEHHSRMCIGVIEKLGYIDHDAGFTVWYPIRANHTDVCDYNHCGGDVCESDILGSPTFQYPSVTRDLARLITLAGNLEEGFAILVATYRANGMKAGAPEHRGDKVVYASNGWLRVGTYVGMAAPTKEEQDSGASMRLILQINCGSYGHATYVLLPCDDPWIVMDDNDDIARCFNCTEKDTLDLIGSEKD